jgi:hypothetical protein
LLPGAQLRGDREPATRGVAGERDVRGLNALLQQPAVGGGRVVDLRRVGVVRGEPVIEAQRTGANRLGDVAEELSMCVDRSADETAAVHAQHHAILGASLRCSDAIGLAASSNSASDPDRRDCS